MSNAAVQAYVDACSAQRVECVLEFVNALATGQRECILADRAIPLRDVDIVTICEALRHPHLLRMLDLEGNRIAMRGIQALIDAMTTNSAVRELHVGRNELGDSATQVLGNALSLNGLGLKVLDLSQNDVGPAGVSSLAQALSAKCCELVELSLHSNRLNDVAAAALANAVASPLGTKLKHLHLGYNALADEGAALLAQALPFSRTLSTLDLSGNQIGAVGGTEIVRSLLSGTCTLQRLNLRHNAFSDETLRLFVEVILRNRTLTQLYLGFMNGSSSVAAQLLAALCDNHRLLLLDLLGWDFGPIHRAQYLLEHVFQQNTTLRTLLCDPPGAAELAVTVDDVNRNRSRRGVPIVYVGDDEQVGAAAVTAASRDPSPRNHSPPSPSAVPPETAMPAAIPSGMAPGLTFGGPASKLVRAEADFALQQPPLTPEEIHALIRDVRSEAFDEGLRLRVAYALHALHDTMLQDRAATVLRFVAVERRLDALEGAKAPSASVQARQMSLGRDRVSSEKTAEKAGSVSPEAVSAQRLVPVERAVPAIVSATLASEAPTRTGPGGAGVRRSDPAKSEAVVVAVDGPARAPLRRLAPASESHSDSGAGMTLPPASPLQPPVDSNAERGKSPGHHAPAPEVPGGRDSTRPELSGHNHQRVVKPVNSPASVFEQPTKSAAPRRPGANRHEGSAANSVDAPGLRGSVARLSAPA